MRLTPGVSLRVHKAPAGPPARRCGLKRLAEDALLIGPPASRGEVGRVSSGEQHALGEAARARVAAQSYQDGVYPSGFRHMGSSQRSSSPSTRCCERRELAEPLLGRGARGGREAAPS